MQLMEKTAEEEAKEARNRFCRSNKCRNKHRTRNKILQKTFRLLQTETTI